MRFDGYCLQKFVEGDTPLFRVEMLQEGFTFPENHQEELINVIYLILYKLIEISSRGFSWVR